MLLNMILIAGTLLVLLLSVGQLLVRRRNSANRVLFSLFLTSSLWILHAVLYRFGMLDRFPHLNKVYLPLLCVTGSLWYSYLRSLHDSTSDDRYNKRNLIPPIACLILSIPFFLENATYKRQYIEVNVTDFPSATMYLATRLAELTLIWFFVKSLYFLNKHQNQYNPIKNIGTSRILWLFTLVALMASIFRVIGSVAGNHTMSVLMPTLLALAVFICMHLFSYRSPVLLSLDTHATRKIKTLPEGASMLDQYREQIRENEWFLDPDLKIRSLARKLGVPPNELSNLINVASNMNFNDFINSFRIEHAQSLLMNTNMSILDISYASGFNSKSVFYKHFSNLTGMTPVKFRKSLDNDELTELSS